MVYFTREPGSADKGGRLNFTSFETHRIDRCIDFIRQLKEQHERVNDTAPDDHLCVVATGGGAFKYYDKLKKALNVDILREEEMECLITGMSFRPQWEVVLYGIGEEADKIAQDSTFSSTKSLMKYSPTTANRKPNT